VVYADGAIVKPAAKRCPATFGSSVSRAARSVAGDASASR